MPINFPNSPNTNDTFTSGSVTYKWDGEKWIGLDSSLSGGATPSQIVTGNTNVQTVDTGSDGHVKITTEGSERVRVTSAGLVGIGSDAPTLGLDIDKGANSGVFLCNSTNGYKLIANVTSANDFGLLIEDEDGVDLYRATSSTGTTNADTHIFSTSGSERLRITSDGRVGINSDISPVWKINIVYFLWLISSLSFAANS